MGSLQIGHPEDEQLLRYADGELPANEAAQVRAHLEACWQCRMELAEIQKVVGHCVEYRRQMRALLPEPPGPWVDLYRRMSEIDTVLARSGFFGRLANAFSGLSRPRRWVPTLVAISLLLAVYYQLRHTPSVEAAALLRKAVSAADARPAALRRIHIRTRQHHLTRVIGIGARDASEAASTASLERLFVAAHYSWEDPLSARSYANWRQQLPEKRDAVSRIPQGYEIRTTTRSNEIQEATLRLNASDLRPLEERLRFRNQEWIEITEAPETPSEIAGSAPGTRPLAEPHVARAPQMPPALATAGDELRVLAALHQLGADLGDPVEVKRSGNRVQVTGVGVSPERQKQIQQALGQLPRVVVEFSDPAAAGPADSQPPPLEVQAPRESERLPERVERQLGGRVFFEKLATQVLDMSDTMMSRAYALRRLAERFPPQVEANLSPADQGVLRRLEQEHAAVLARQTAELQRLLHPVLVPLGGAPPAEAHRGIAAGAWQPAAEELFQAARRSEALLAAVFAGAPSPVTDAQLPPELLASLTRLHVCAEAYQRLLAPPSGEPIK